MSNVKERAIVKFAYTPQYEGSDELKLNIGDIVYITSRENEADGWLAGEIKGVEGVFPSSYVELLDSKTNVPPPPGGKGVKTNDIQLTDFGNSAEVKHVAPSAPLAVARVVSMGDNRGRKRQTLFGLYASYASIMSGMFYAVTGLVLLCWGAYGYSPTPINDEYKDLFEYYDAIVGFWAVVTGLAIVLYEIRWGHIRYGKHTLSFRGFAYILAIAPGYIALPTAVGGSTLIVPILLHMYASWTREYYIPPPPPRPAAKQEGDEEWAKVSFCDKVLTFVGGKNPDRQISRIVFLICYIAGNVAAGVTHALKAYDSIQDVKDWNENNRKNPQVPPVPDRDYHTYWLLVSKFFGNMMNLNYSIILLPVSYSLMRWLVNNSRHRAWYSYPLRAIIWLFPVDETIRIHKLCGWVGFISAIIHTVAHVFNYVSKAQLVWDTFGASIWATGISLIMILFILYPATIPTIRRGHFEIFWVTHFLFVALIAIAVIHGKNTIGPNYWKWQIFPGSVYFLERVYREITTRKPVKVMSVTFLSNQVISLSIEKSGALRDYCEGQYAFISCPSISSFQWHPFTISSAPQENTVTFHIRVQGKGSWTHGLDSFFRVLGAGSRSACLKLAHMEDGVLVPGLVNGPSNTPLLRIHGPYSAPTQHFSDYNQVIVSASGIGVTPLASALKSIVHYRWRFSVQRAFPDKALFVWVVAHKEIPAFRWFIRTIHEAEATLNQLNKTQNNAITKDSPQRDLKIMIFVTSYSAKESEAFERQTIEEKGADDAGLWGMSYYTESGLSKAKLDWDEMDLYSSLMSPKKEVVTYGNVSVHRSRPDWENIFGNIQNTTVENNIGVTFCGNPGIGKSLKENCLRFSLKDNKKVKWHLHKEVF